MLAIEEAIQKLGYAHSAHLFRMSNIDSCSEISLHNKKILLDLKPYAFYVADRKILVVFFDDLPRRDNQGIRLKIWNAQFPLIISDEGDCIVIYNGTTLVNMDNPLKRLLSVNINDCNENSGYSYWNLKSRIKNWQKEKSGNNLNSTLLANLKYVVDRLRNEYRVSSANRLILRVLFIRYLIDRGVDLSFCGICGDCTTTRNRFLEIVKDKKQFIALTEKLNQRFNGNLFEAQSQHEWEEITPESLNMLHDFLSGDIELGTGQLLLFPVYDFNIIPIELISSIYEILIGSYKKSKDKAYYTPEGLADYIVDKTVKRHLADKKECRVLDPSCGSGIFLVKSLQRILEKNADSQGFIGDNGLICKLLENNIFGIDYNEEAVDVTVFSLYVTLLDYKNIKSLNNFKLPLLKGRNILTGDFFDEKATASLIGRHYDAILGNPPWGSVEHDLYIEYCTKKNAPLPDKDISAAFLFKTMDIGMEKTVCSLVMPAKMLYKKRELSVKLRRNWLDSVQVEWVLELSSVRRTLFSDAIAPAVVVSYTCKKSSPDHRVEYMSIRPNMYLEEFGIIAIEPDDIKYVPQNTFIEHDEIWKILVFGTSWDFDILQNLRDMPTIGDVLSENRLKTGVGLQALNGDTDVSDLQGRRMLKSRNAINHFQLKAIFEKFRKTEIHRRRDPDLFKAPYVLTSKGIDSHDLSFRSVYSEVSFLYTDAICGIKGDFENKDILLNICGLLNSSLFSYFNLMLGSSVGIEREQFFLDELKKYPYAYSDSLRDVVRESTETNMSQNDIRILREKVNNCVLDMYGLKHNPFIDYALNVRIPEICKRYLAKKCSDADMRLYADTFQSIWDRHFEGSGVYCTTILYPSIKNQFSAYEINLSSNEELRGVQVMTDAEDDISLLSRFGIYKLNDSFFQIKSVIHLTQNRIIIIKPNDTKYWHPAMAVKDSHKVISDILTGRIIGNED